MQTTRLSMTSEEIFSSTNDSDCYPDKVERSGFLKPYISKKEASNLKLHVYSGTDAGIFYIYFYSPLSEFLVSRLPEYIAPNTLTMIGFMHTVLPITILYIFIGTALIGDLPSWFLYAQGWFYFIYRLLDEMDGK